MRTQTEIVERIRTTKNSDVHGTAMLFRFLERAGQIEIMGKQIAKTIGVHADGFHEPLTIKDIGPMMIELIGQARNWEPVGGRDENDRVQLIRKANLRALSWLVEDDTFFCWTRELRDLLNDLERRYLVGTS